MPRKANIVAVPVDAATVAEPVEQAAQEDKTDAEEMTNVINEIKTDVQPMAEPVAPRSGRASDRAKAQERTKSKGTITEEG